MVPHGAAPVREGVFPQEDGFEIMGIIKASRLIFDYIRRDEEENIQEVDRAIDNLNVDIQKGSFVAILGHNGSGKSTLVKTLGGLVRPNEGEILIDGKK